MTRSGSTMKRGVIVIAFLVLIAAAVVAIGGQGLRDLMRYEKEVIRQEFEGGAAVGYRWIPRWEDERFVRIQLWNEATGFLVYEAWSDDGANRFDNYWRPDGVLYRQTVLEPGVRQEARVEAPWFEGGADQLEPTSPWFASGAK